MRRSAPALLLAALLGCIATPAARAQSECPLVLHAPAGGVRWCDLAEKPHLTPDAPLPAYNAMVRAARYSGEVDLTADVDDSGRVVPASVHVLFSTHDLFLVSARAAVRQWRFLDPAGSAGRPLTLFVRAVFEIPPEDVPTTPVADVTPTRAGLDLRLGYAAIPFAPPAHADSGDLFDAMAAAIDTTIALHPPDSLRTICVAHDRKPLPARVMAALHTPAGRTFAPDRCPPTAYGSLRVVDSLGRSPRAPAGHRNPLWLDVVDVQPWTRDVFRMRVRATVGSAGFEYPCDARRETTNGSWRADCESHSWLGLLY